MSGDQDGMENPAQCEHQALWDRLLIESWRHDAKLIHLVFNFLSGIGQADKRDLDYGDIAKYLDGLGLKRWRYASGNIFFGTRVRVAVGIACQRLQGCLMNPKVTDKQILDAIQAFKWRRLSESSRLKHHSSKMVERSRRRTEDRRTITIRARELTKDHDWSTVK